MSRMRLLVPGMLVVLASCTVIATSASAASFDLAGSTKTDELAEPKVSETEPIVFGAEGEPEISCKKVQERNSVITNGSPTVKIPSINFDGCVDKSNEKCELGTIKTKEMLDTLEETGKKEEDDTIEKFAPIGAKGTEKAEFASFSLKGSGCTTTAKLELAGDFISKKEDNEGSEDDHKLQFEVTAGSHELEYGDQLEFAFLRGRLTLTLLVPIEWGLF